MTRPQLQRHHFLCIALSLLSLLCSSVLALDRDELALICNKKVPASVQLAKFYAQARNVPTDHIIELDLPDSEIMPAGDFDRDVVAPLREGLTSRQLKGKVKCLLTFYGVPLKLSARPNTPQEDLELSNLKQQSDEILRQMIQAIVTLETRLKTIDPKFVPASSVDFQQTVRRGDAALQLAGRLLAQTTDPQVRQEISQAAFSAIGTLGGKAGLVRQFRPNATPQGAAEDQFAQMAREVRAAVHEAQALAPRRDDAAARARHREVAQAVLGLITTHQVIQSQIEFLGSRPVMAFDNELAMLWADSRSFRTFSPNPLHYRSAERSTTPAVMVCRLDGPQSGTARDIVLSCKSVEASGGLHGRVVIDSGARPAKVPEGQEDPYARFDQRLLDLADLVRKHTLLPLYSDNAPEVIPAHSQTDVALYCGWYSLRKYVPACQLVPGAIGVHIASFEMVTLHAPGETGWCAGLLKDGVASTLGAVDEPYLFAFPDPVDYFGLIMTGRYTLAESYWLTTPQVNWKITLIGDPLYNPFTRRPPLKAEDLPADLRKFVEADARTSGH